ncbi:MAG: T9SS type A sorting domain-containing protein [Bacteroidota bacterium]
METVIMDFINKHIIRIPFMSRRLAFYPPILLAFFLIWTVTLSAQPLVNLGNDTASCGTPVLLDAGNAGSTFLWSTSETTQTISVTSSGIYWVDVTDMSGTTRDSIFVEIVSTPTGNDTSLNICGPQQVNLGIASTPTGYRWYDSLNATDPFVVQGGALGLFLQDSSTFYYEPFEISKPIHTGPANGAGLNISYRLTNNGIVFDMLSDGIIDSVSIITNGPVSFTLRIETLSGTIIDSVLIDITSSGTHPIPLFMEVPQGDDYVMISRNFSSPNGSGMAWARNLNSFPYELPGLIRLTDPDDFRAGRYYFFWDWVVSRKVCVGPRQEFKVNILPAPNLELGADTTLCGSSLLLDATSPGATYIWQDASTNPTFTVTQSGTYSVASTFMGCTLVDSVSVFLIEEANIDPLTTVDICGPQTVGLLPNGTFDVLFWYDSLNAPVRRAITNGIYDTFISDSTTLYVSGVNLGETIHVGIEDPNLFSNSFLSSLAGMEFDMLSDGVLDSVTIFTSGTGPMRIILENSSGTIIDSALVEFPSAGKNQIPLFFEIPQGFGYALRGESFGPVTNSFQWVRSGVSAPYIIPNLIEITNATGGRTDRVFHFFDWVMSQKNCVGPRQSYVVNVLPAPALDLGINRVECGSSFTLDVSSPGASYLWQDGSTNATFTLTQTGNYSVASTLGSCTLRDTVTIELNEIPTVSSGEVLEICGPQEVNLSPSGNPDRFIWYADSLGENRIGISESSFKTQISDSTTLYYRGVNQALSQHLEPKDFSGFSSATRNTDLGVTFDAFVDMVIDSVSLISTASSSILISLEDVAGNVLDSVRTSVSGSGTFQIPLFFEVPQGTAYSLIGKEISGPGSFRIISGGINYPLVTEELMQFTGTTDGTTALGRYHYVFDWVVSRKFCDSGIFPYQINVLPAPVLNLGFDRGECGSSFIVDAFSPGATYLWSTGDTSSSITITQSDTVFVASTLETCTLFDTVSIELVPFAENTLIQDTLICGKGEFELSITSGADFTGWYASDSVSTFFQQGRDLSLFISDTTTVYLEQTNFSAPQNIGYEVPNPNVLGYQPGERGVAFDAFSAFTLKSVVVYAQQVTDVKITLVNANRVRLDSIVAFVNGQAGTRVTLGFEVPVGNDYLLLAESTDGTLLGRYNGPEVNYPYVLENIASIKTDYVSGTSIIYFLYDWEVALASCKSDRVPFTITPKLPLELGEDIFSCNPISLDAGNPNFEFLWNTGDTTQQIIADRTGMYSVVVSDGADCQVRDTLELTIPTLNLGDDGKFCGFEIASGYDASSIFMWSTGDTTPSINITNPGTYYLSMTESIGNCFLTDTIQIDSLIDFPSIELGGDVQECVSAVIDAGVGATTYLWNTGDTTQILNVQTSGIYSVEITNEFGCASRDTISVFIAPLPNAAFVSNPNGLTIQFVNQSSLGSYSWDFGDGFTSSSISPIHTYQDSGDYVVCLIVNDFLNNCGQDTLCSTITVKPLNTFSPGYIMPEMEVFPNPTESLVHVNILNPPSAKLNLALFDLTGQLILDIGTQTIGQSADIELSLESLPAGTYIIRADWSNGVYANSLIIKR